MSGTDGIRRYISLRGCQNKKYQFSERFVHSLIKQSIQHEKSMLNCNPQQFEIEYHAIQQLIEKYASGFGLDGEPLPVTHLIKGKGSDSSGSYNPRARKIQRYEDESSDSGEE
jgi:hypothetical protein